MSMRSLQACKRALTRAWYKQKAWHGMAEATCAADIHWGIQTSQSTHLDIRYSWALPSMAEATAKATAVAVRVVVLLHAKRNNHEQRIVTTPARIAL